MSTTEEPPGRQALAPQLELLQDELRNVRPRKSQKAAVEEANRRRRAAAGRPKDVPWPRDKGGVDLSPTTVNEWFPKLRGSKEPRVPHDFQDLWSVVAVMLEWTGQLTDKPSAGRLRHYWDKLHADAQRGTSLDEEVRGYLEAARKVAEEHPYPGLLGQPPSLTEVYVRQRSRTATREGLTPTGGGSTQGGSGTGFDVPTEAAEVIFRVSDRVCVLIAGPGGGKSTLLRTWLRDAAGEWLGSPQVARKFSRGVPVWVSARALAGEETQVPDALTAATRMLSQYGRHPELAKARFLERPCTGTYWQVLVDDLDELPNADERRAVLQKLANAVTQDPPIYRCVVATRPLTENELNVLGGATPHYQLQPFTINDLHTYIEKCFSTRWPRHEAAHRARRFAAALYEASLAELARTPLMAFMLCQLYLAKPERLLPDGRTAVYQAFTDLLYEKNRRKRIRASHQEAIEHLVEDLQGFRARQETHDAAQQVYERLSELIDYLAHQWLTGHQTSVTEALASHEAVHRPGKVNQKRWETFLEGLLRHTGLLVHHADGLGFTHQTFLEYHAALHATRDERARAELLDELFPSGQKPRVPATEPSYLGFLLDGLLASPDGIADETMNRIEALTRQEGVHRIHAHHFLVDQVNMRSNLPAEPTARLLTRFADDTTLHGSYRIPMAESLARVDGYREEGANRLIAFADDTTLDDDTRARAAVGLAKVDGYREEGADRLIAFADDTTLHGSYRIPMAESLARVDGYREEGADRLIAFADDTTLDDDTRARAAVGLAKVDGYREEGADRLIAFADDTTLDDDTRASAVESLARVDGYRDRAAHLFAQLADDPTLKDSTRASAAESLASVDGHREEGADRLIAFAHDPTFDDDTRASVPHRLARVDGHRNRAALLFAQLADDPTINNSALDGSALDGSALVHAVEHLAGMDGYRDRAAHLFAQLADDPTLKDSTRARAAMCLARMDGYREEGVNRLTAFAHNTTLDILTRIRVVGGLAAIRGDGGTEA
ncbi:hypothetical protein ABZZ36_28600 [Actinacidiphila glaucinigra]|uniref:NACHT domain-containing protein n=1 Tax=Actinacidiphila glaucinigra TaxID=235986 RepID=UPI0033ACBDE7